MNSSDSDITGLLLAWGEGSAQAIEALTPLVYQHLHRLARNYMAGEHPGHTLQRRLWSTKPTCAWLTPGGCTGKTARISMLWRLS